MEDLPASSSDRRRASIAVPAAILFQRRIDERRFCASTSPVPARPQLSGAPQGILRQASILSIKKQFRCGVVTQVDIVAPSASVLECGSSRDSHGDPRARERRGASAATLKLYKRDQLRRNLRNPYPPCRYHKHPIGPGGACRRRSSVIRNDRIRSGPESLPWGRWRSGSSECSWRYMLLTGLPRRVIFSSVC